MENKKLIPVIAVVSALCFMLVFADNGFIQTAYALTQNLDTNLSGASNQCRPMQSSRMIVCIPNESASTSHVLSYFRSDIENPTINTLTIYPQEGGCSSPSNPCSASSGSVSCYNCNYNKDGSTDRPTASGTLGGLWCGITDCFFYWITGGSYSNQLIRVSFTTIDPIPSGLVISGYMNITSSTSIAPVIWGVDLNTGGIGGISLFSIRCPTVCGTGTLYKTGGTSLMGDVATVTTNQAFSNTQSLDGCWFCDGNTSNNSNNKLVAISSRQAVNTNRAVTVIRADLMTELCGQTNSGGSYNSGSNTGIIRFYNGSRWAYVVDDSLYLLNRTTCAKTATVTYATLGLSNYVQDIRMNTTKVFWVQHGSTNTQNSVTQVNATTFNTLVNFDSVIGNTITGYIGGSTSLKNTLTADVVSHILVRTDTTSKMQILFLNNFNNGGGSSGGGIVNGICTGLLKDCINGAGGGLSGFLPNGYNFTSAGTTIGQGLGIVDVNNDDPQTNGVGLFYMLATGTLFAGITFATIATANSKFNTSIKYSEVPKEYWLFLVIGVVALAFYLHWIPDIVFYGMVIGLAGLFSFGLYRHYSSGSG